MTIDVSLESVASWDAGLDGRLQVLTCRGVAHDGPARTALLPQLSERLTQALRDGPGVPRVWVLVTDRRVIPHARSAASMIARKRSLVEVLAERGIDLSGHEVTELEIDVVGRDAAVRAALVETDPSQWGWAVQTIHTLGVIGIVSWAGARAEEVQAAARRVLSADWSYGPALRFEALQRIGLVEHGLAMLSVFGWFDDRDFGVELFLPESLEAEALAAGCSNSGSQR